MDTIATTFLSANHFQNIKYGKLRMMSPSDSSRGSHRKVEWICDCGRSVIASVCDVVSGGTVSCGKCGLLTADYWENIKYGSLRLKFPQDLLPKSKKKHTWICDCGREVDIQVTSVTSGHTKTCGKCSILSAEHFRVTKYGKLKMANPCESHPSSHTEVLWKCDCGQTTVRPIWLVTSGHTSSCGLCNVKSLEYWTNTEFGQLRMSDPQSISPGSNKKVKWKCKCGGILESIICDVTAGKTTRCGLCQSRAVKWYKENEQLLRSLKTPISVNDIPSGWIQPLEDVKKYCEPFPALCGACGERYDPIWGNIVKGSSLTCGCASNHISMAQQDLASWFESLGLEVIMEHPIDKYKYDIYIPSKNFLLEYNGLRWHSGLGAKRRDLQKYNNAINAGFDFISLFEDEWTFKRTKVEQLLKNRLSLSGAQSIRPSECKIRTVLHSEVKPLYDEFHYIGSCNAKLHYGVFLDNKIIAAISFGYPTRQSIHPWELLRMVSNSEYKIHGVWSKIFGLFIQQNDPTSIVSFSDNRLFSGRIYNKLGFKLDGEVLPDYYWVKANKRYHKSGLRKKGNEKKSLTTEEELRTQQGFSKIWDLGKKRWVWRP